MRDNDRARDYYEDDFDGGAPRVDWAEYYHAVRERLWIVVLLVVLGGIGAAVYMTRQSQRFQARAVLVFEAPQTRALEKVEGAVETETTATPDAINTMIDMLASYPFAQRVAERLKLNEDPRFLGGAASKTGVPMTVDEAAGTLVREVSVAARPKTNLVDILVTHRLAPMAIEIANAYIDEYIRYGLERRASANKAANQYLLDEAERLRRQMRVSEEAMQSFRERERAASPEKQQQTSENKLNEISASITEVQNKLFQLDNDLKAAGAAVPGDIETLLSLPSIAAEPKVAAVNQALAEQERQFALLKQTYRAKHPLYIAAETQITTLVRNRNQVLQDSVNLLRGERGRLQAQLDELKKAQQDQQGNLLSVTGKSVEYNDLKRALETNTAMYNAILSRLTVIDVTKGMTDLPVQVHERALGATPIGVNPIKIYTAALAFGLAAGLGLVIGLHMLDHSIKTIDQAERLSGVPVLSAIPKKTKNALRSLDVVTDRQGIVAEAFRSLRTSLALGTSADHRRTFLFTSALPSEGKTFCSCNFAATLGQQGFKTLIIDADLRKPMVSRVFFGSRRKPGLTEVLTKQIPLSEAIIVSEMENVSVLTTGGGATNPSELLSAQNWNDVLKEAMLIYDRIVIDSAPVLAVSDSLLLAPHVDVTCLVIRSFKTPTKTVARALKALTEIQCTPVGTVINFMPTGAGSYYYYSGKYYGSYGEKNVYGA